MPDPADPERHRACIALYRTAPVSPSVTTSCQAPPIDLASPVVPPATAPRSSSLPRSRRRAPIVRLPAEPPFKIPVA